MGNAEYMGMWSLHGRALAMCRHTVQVLGVGRRICHFYESWCSSVRPQAAFSERVCSSLRCTFLFPCSHQWVGLYSQSFEQFIVVLGIQAGLAHESVPICEGA